MENTKNVKVEIKTQAAETNSQPIFKVKPLPYKVYKENKQGCVR